MISGSASSVFRSWILALNLAARALSQPPRTGDQPLGPNRSRSDSFSHCLWKVAAKWFMKSCLKVQNLNMRSARGLGLAAATFACSAIPALAAVNVLLTEVPDYTWDAGCFGTGSGNLMGYWDRHGMADFYTGPTGN